MTANDQAARAAAEEIVAGLPITLDVIDCTFGGLVLDRRQVTAVLATIISRHIAQAREDETKELVEALEQISYPSCGCMPVCRCSEPEDIAIRMEEAQEIARTALAHYRAKQGDRDA